MPLAARDLSPGSPEQFDAVFPKLDASHFPGISAPKFDFPKQRKEPLENVSHVRGAVRTLQSGERRHGRGTFSFSKSLDPSVMAATFPSGFPLTPSGGCVAVSTVEFFGGGGELLGSSKLLSIRPTKEV